MKLPDKKHVPEPVPLRVKLFGNLEDLQEDGCIRASHWHLHLSLFAMAKPSSAAEASKGENFLRQFRDLKTREFKRITAGQFMDVWNHYDTDGG
nr:hypothetical protein BaRGS_029300 [Batillaria attramentaria]